MSVCWSCSISSINGGRNLKLIKLDKLDMGEIEAQFGLVVREKDNHNNYALFRFEDLEKIVSYYDLFKKEVKK